MHGRLHTNKGILQCGHIITVVPARHYCDINIYKFFKLKSFVTLLFES